MFGKNKYSRRGFHPMKILFFGVVFIVFIFVLAWVVQVLWNAILPDVVSGVKPLTYWQAMGLLILFKILFGFGGRSKQWSDSKKGRWKSKWENMSEEKRERIKSRWKSRCEQKDKL